MKIKCPSCKKEIVQVSHSPGVVESGAEVECGACGNIWTPFPARGGGDKTADLGRRPAAGRPPIAGESATGQIQLRVTMARKNAYVRAAKPKKLTAWIFEKLDKASGYEQI